MRRRVLLVSPFPPHRDGLHGTSRWIGSLIVELAISNEVRLIYLQADDELPIEPALGELCKATEAVRRPGGRVDLERAALMAAAFRLGLPFWAGNWRVQAFRRRLQRVIQEWQPDVVQFEGHVMAQYRGAVPPSCPTVLVIHEPGTTAARDRLSRAPFWAKPMLRRELACWQKYERAVLPGFDAVVCFSARDRGATLAAGANEASTAVIPLRVFAIPRLLEAPAGADPVVFLAGNFMHPPNREAALRLARDIFPGVRERCQTANLCIAGADPPADLQGFASDSIRITGRVPDMQPLLAAGTVVALPLHSGGGTRVKMVEALAAGKPVVGTRLAAEGLGLQDGVHFLCAESDAEFIDAIAQLLSDEAARKRLIRSALEWAESWCRPGTLNEEYEALYAGLRRS